MSKITFLASENKDYSTVLHYYQDIEFLLNFKAKIRSNVTTSDLSFLSFDLLETFDHIELYYSGKFYDLKLGSNTWTEKELRKEHNLLKLVKSNILNK